MSNSDKIKKYKHWEECSLAKIEELEANKKQALELGDIYNAARYHRQIEYYSDRLNEIQAWIEYGVER